MRHSDAAHRAIFVRRAVSSLCIATMALQTACFSYAPLGTMAPSPAQQVGVVINDRGRTLLGERVGALVDRIDGRIVSADSQNVVLDVYRVTDLRGTATTWTGERVTIPRDAVLGFRERKISKFRVLALVAVAAVAVFAVLQTSFDFFGDPKTDDPAPPPGKS